MTTNRNLLLALVLALSPLLLAVADAAAGEIDASQQRWVGRYSKHANTPDPATMRLNTDPEPDLTQGFESLFKSGDLSGWTALGGHDVFEMDGDEMVARSKGSKQSTYLCSEDDSWGDFVMTCEVFWEIDGNTGVMFRARTRPRTPRNAKKLPDQNPGPELAAEDVEVYGPQVELEGFEGFAKGRGWSGAAYGQSCGGYWYPLWLEEHAAARAALKRGEWNRMTLHAQGNVIRTWINGVPCAYWIDDGSYPKGRLGFQVHKNDEGVMRWRNVKAKRLDSAGTDATSASQSAQAMVASIEAAHGTAAYQQHAAVEAEFSVLYPGRVDLQGTILFDTPVGKSRITLNDGTVWVFDGEQAWVAPGSTQTKRARFHLLTWPYFFAAAHKLNDPGTHRHAPELLPALSLEDTRPAVKVSFDPGTGDAPDDWYKAFQDDQGRVDALAYIVTYNNKDAAKAEKRPSICTYDAFETQGGVTYPTAWTTWFWKPDAGIVGKKHKGKTHFKNVRFVTPPADAFVKPAGATEDPLPGA